MAVTSDSECVKSASREACSFCMLPLHLDVDFAKGQSCLCFRASRAMRDFRMPSLLLAAGQGDPETASAKDDARRRGKPSRHPPRRSIFGMFSRRRWAAGSAATAWEGSVASHPTLPGSRTAPFCQPKSRCEKRSDLERSSQASQIRRSWRSPVPTQSAAPSRRRCRRFAHLDKRNSEGCSMWQERSGACPFGYGEQVGRPPHLSESIAI